MLGKINVLSREGVINDRRDEMYLCAPSNAIKAIFQGDNPARDGHMPHSAWLHDNMRRDDSEG